jgi:glutathione S-transferase
VKLYQTYTSPFPTRVRLCLYAKGLDCEIIEPPGFHATPESKGDYMLINPIGRVPTLITDDGRALPESEVICEYLEDAYPDPPLLPPDAWGRSQVRLISRLCDFYLVMAMRPLFDALGKARRSWNQPAIDRGLAAIETALGYIEHHIGDGPYAVGDRLTWADGALVPQLMLSYDWAPALFDSPSPLGQHPKLARYWAAAEREPILSRLLRETREAVAHEQAIARTLAQASKTAP